MPTSHVRHDRVCGGVRGLSKAQAAHMEVDRHLELPANAVILCTGWVLGDHTLYMPQPVREVVVMRPAACYGCYGPLYHIVPTKC